MPRLCQTWQTVYEFLKTRARNQTAHVGGRRVSITTLRYDGRDGRRQRCRELDDIQKLGKEAGDKGARRRTCRCCMCVGVSRSYCVHTIHSRGPAFFVEKFKLSTSRTATARRKDGVPWQQRCTLHVVTAFLNGNLFLNGFRQQQ